MGVRIPSNIWLKDGRSCLAVGLWTISHMMNFHSKSKLTKSWGTKNKANLPKRLQCSVYIQLLPLFKQALPSCKKHTKLQKPLPQRLPQENLYHIFQVPSPNPKQNNHKTTPNKHIQTNLFQPPPRRATLTLVNSSRMGSHKLLTFETSSAKLWLGGATKPLALDRGCPSSQGRGDDYLQRVNLRMLTSWLHHMQSKWSNKILIGKYIERMFHLWG